MLVAVAELARDDALGEHRHGARHLRITPISVTTPVMHATMIDSIKELPPEIDFSSSGGIVLWRHRLALVPTGAVEWQLFV